jgi:ABC-type anion transport system duplicated permease subunit
MNFNIIASYDVICLILQILIYVVYTGVPYPRVFLISTAVLWNVSNLVYYSQQRLPIHVMAHHL